MVVVLPGAQDRSSAHEVAAGAADRSYGIAVAKLAGLPPTVVARAKAVLAKLETLPIKGRAPKTGYSREQFGPAWSDDVTVADGHNGCDTRNDILRRDLVDIETKPGTDGCVVLSGILNDPYTGTTVDFQRGRGTSSEVQIDHIVALLDAWQKGAQQWDEVTRRNFANDPLNLQATSGPINEQKGDGDAATWLPPNKSYRCTYVSRIVAVKAQYGVWVTQAEHDAIARTLTNCGAPAAAPGQPPTDPGAEYVPPTATRSGCSWASRAAACAPSRATTRSRKSRRRAARRRRNAGAGPVPLRWQR